MEVLQNLTIKIDTVAEQTRVRIRRTSEKASSISSEVRRTFFVCPETPLVSEMCSLKRFDPPGKKAELLLAEVKRYVCVMRDKCLAGYVKEVDHVQPEIGNQFWQNTRSFQGS